MLDHNIDTALLILNHLLKEISALTFSLLIVHAINFVCLTIRRLHDFNYKGWWILIAFMPAVICELTNARIGLPWVVATLIYLAFIMVMVAVPGTGATNRFGDEPPLPSSFCKRMGFTLGILLLLSQIAMPFMRAVYPIMGFYDPITNTYYEMR